ncbi:MAG: [FeFe] hydrogenase H-cluster maturation GTPase HydF [Clostridiales bacterium]|jgi:[FeFe] hydrogenase H-cluster maturation GTPase HydF|nr:[FeFe] hydrogenase H-cluster maturation GTPase HydF [Clostridiales bacterium]
MTADTPTLNSAPGAVRVKIGFFGRRNAGKSRLVNAVTGQDLSVVSDVAGTTTDPVRKSMELLPLGPVLIIDTPGIDDEGELGDLRVRKTRQILRQTDFAVLVIDAVRGETPADSELARILEESRVPYIIAYNKSDLLYEIPKPGPNEIYISAVTGLGIAELKERAAAMGASAESEGRLVGDLLKPADVVLLVTPIDSAAPKGRLILPQQQVVRDILEAGAVSVVIREFELKETLHKLREVDLRMVITDSQAFKLVAEGTPENVPLTSFSILFARYKGLLEASIAGVRALDSVQDSDTILICEGCTHHRQCDDIGTVKLPRLLREFTGKSPRFEFTSGGEFPEKPDCKLVIHCGGCMQGDREMRFRHNAASAAGVPFTNYGVALAYTNGILARAVAPFGYTL